MRADPSEGGRRVYGDLLCAQGDVHGELIASMPKDPDRFQALLASGEVLGALAKFPVHHQFAWRLRRTREEFRARGDGAWLLWEAGFIDEAKLQVTGRRRVSAARWLEALLPIGPALLLRKLEVDLHLEGEGVGAALAKMASDLVGALMAAAPEQLQQLKLSVTGFEGEFEERVEVLTPVPRLGALVEALPGLRSLQVLGTPVVERPFSHPELTVLDLGPRPEGLEHLGASRLPRLTRLRLGAAPLAAPLATQLVSALPALEVLEVAPEFAPLFEPLAAGRFTIRAR